MQARRERHSNARRAIGEAARLGRSGNSRGLPSRRTLIVLLIVIVVGGIVLSLDGTSSNSPRLATSCITPAAAVADVNGSSDPRYSITGPASGTYLVTIDAVTAKVVGDGVDLTPKNATAVAIKKGLEGCKGDGALPSDVGPGHQLVIFRDGKPVARAKISGL